MILIQRIITFLSPLLIAVAFELAIYQTIKLSIAGALALLIVFLSVFKLSGAKRTIAYCKANAAPHISQNSSIISSTICQPFNIKLRVFANRLETRIIFTHHLFV